MINIAVCCIIKNESNYIREFVEYYKQQGVSKIYLYDNNDNLEDYPFVQINDYIIDNFVYVTNYRNRPNAKTDAYNECYKLYNSAFDWMLFVDCDEFIEVPKYGTLQNWLTHNKYSKFDVVRINLRVYTDNNYINANETYSCLQRFTEPSLKTISTINRVGKSLVKCGLKKVIWQNQFYPITPGYHCGTNSEVIDKSYTIPVDMSIAYIKDFVTKSVTEYCNIKLIRKQLNVEQINHYIDFFFSINEKTEEKQQIIDKYLIDNVTSSVQVIY